MEHELKQEWIKALRSGDYRQGRGRLKIEEADGHDGYCCLGVLANVFDKDRWECDEGDWFFGGDEVDFSYSNLGEVGLDKEVQTVLIKFNDGDGECLNEDFPACRTAHVMGKEYCEKHRPRTFEEIADYIEENL